MSNGNGNSVNVINNSGQTIVTLDAFDSSTNPPPGNQIYEMPLTLRSTSTGNSIASGATGSVSLDADRSIYDFIFARPADLFPIQDSSVMQGIFSGQYSDQTVLSTSPAQMALALQFYINILTYPTSQIAQNYQTALTGATANSGSADDIDGAVTAFFQGTKQYTTLTLDAVVTAQTFSRGFAYVWAGFPDTTFGSFNQSMTYYLYSPGTPPSNSNQADPISQGTLVLQKKASAPNPADPTDRNGGYTITYNPPSGAATPMFFANGQFVSDPTSDFPSIALSGSFVLKSTLTYVATDNVIIPMVAGLVNGIQVVGTPIQQGAAGGGGDSNQGFFYTFLHPQTFSGWLGVFGTCFGVVMGLEWVGSKCKALRDWCKTQKTPPSENDIQQQRKQLNDQDAPVQAADQKVLQKVNPDAQVPKAEDLGNAMQQAQGDVVNANNVAQADAQLDGLSAAAGQLQQAAAFGANPGIEKAAGDIRSAAENVESALASKDPATLADAVAATPAKITNINSEVQTVVDGVQSSLSADGKAVIAEAKANASEAEDVSEQADDAANDANDGAGGDDDLDITATEAGW